MRMGTGFTNEIHGLEYSSQWQLILMFLCLTILHFLIMWPNFLGQGVSINFSIIENDRNPFIPSLQPNHPKLGLDSDVARKVNQVQITNTSRLMVIHHFLNNNNNNKKKRHLNHYLLGWSTIILVKHLFAISMLIKLLPL